MTASGALSPSLSQCSEQKRRPLKHPADVIPSLLSRPLYHKTYIPRKAVIVDDTPQNFKRVAALGVSRRMWPRCGPYARKSPRLNSSHPLSVLQENILEAHPGLLSPGGHLQSTIEEESPTVNSMQTPEKGLKCTEYLQGMQSQANSIPDKATQPRVIRRRKRRDYSKELLNLGPRPVRATRSVRLNGSSRELTERAEQNITFCPEGWSPSYSNDLRDVDLAAFVERERKNMTLCVCTLQDGCGETCLNRHSQTECYRGICPLKQRYCGNRQIQKKAIVLQELLIKRKANAVAIGVSGRNVMLSGVDTEPLGFKVVKVPNKGYGLIATRDIEPGEFIIEYTGKAFTQAQAEEFVKENMPSTPHFYGLSLCDGIVLDSTRTGSEARFVNHSCAPNCVMEKWIVNGFPRIALFAGKNLIKKGVELTYDYNFCVFVGAKPQVCKCGAPNCRGLIGKKSEDMLSRKLSVSPASSTEDTPTIVKRKRRVHLDPNSPSQHQRRVAKDAHESPCPSGRLPQSATREPPGADLKLKRVWASRKDRHTARQQEPVTSQTEAVHRSDIASSTPITSISSNLAGIDPCKQASTTQSPRTPTRLEKSDVLLVDQHSVGRARLKDVLQDTADSLPLDKRSSAMFNKEADQTIVSRKSTHRKGCSLSSEVVTNIISHLESLDNKVLNLQDTVDRLNTQIRELAEQSVDSGHSSAKCPVEKLAKIADDKAARSRNSNIVDLVSDESEDLVIQEVADDHALEAKDLRDTAAGGHSKPMADVPGSAEIGTGASESLKYCVMVDTSTSYESSSSSEGIQEKSDVLPSLLAGIGTPETSFTASSSVLEGCTHQSPFKINGRHKFIPTPKLDTTRGPQKMHYNTSYPAKHYTDINGRRPQERPLRSRGAHLGAFGRDLSSGQYVHQRPVDSDLMPDPVFANHGPRVTVEMSREEGGTGGCKFNESQRQMSMISASTCPPGYSMANLSRPSRSIYGYGRNTASNELSQGKPFATLQNGPQPPQPLRFAPNIDAAIMEKINLSCNTPASNWTYSPCHSSAGDVIGTYVYPRYAWYVPWCGNVMSEAQSASVTAIPIDAHPGYSHPMEEGHNYCHP